MDYTWQYYDLVLVGVAASMLVGAGVGVLSSLSLTSSVTGAGVVAVGFIGHALFVNGPVDEPEDLTNEVDALN